MNSSPLRRPTARTNVGSTPGRPLRSSSVVSPIASISITSSTVKPISCLLVPPPPPPPPSPASSPLPNSRMIVEPAGPASGDGSGEGGGRPSARHPSTTVTSVPRTFTSPATTGGAPGIRVVGRRGRISRTWSTSAAQANVPTRNTSNRTETRLPSVIGCEEAKILQGVRLSKQICAVLPCRLSECGTHVLGPFGRERQLDTGHRMRERKRRRVQQLARRQRLEPLRFRPCRRRHAATPTKRVLAVADDGTADVREVHTNLVRATGAESDAEQVDVREPRDDGGVGRRVPAALRDRHPFAVFGIARDRRFDVDHILAQMSPHERRVHTLHGPLLDGARQAAVGEIAFRDDEQPGRVAVEPMHDPWTARFRGRAARQLGAPPDQHIHERVVPVAGTRMDDESRRLVEHREVLVLIHEIQSGVVGRVNAWGCFVGQLDRDFHPAFQKRRGAQRFAAHGHALVGDEASGLGTRKGELVSEKTVETFSGSNDTESDVQGSAARASFARCCARPSCHSESPSAIAPIVMAESATLKVGQRQAPMPTSTKSTTPCALRIRSIKLPTAPPHTSASAISRNRSPGRVPRTSDASTNSATTARPRKIQREFSPTCRPNAAPSLYTRRNCTTSPTMRSGSRRARNDSAISLVTKSETTTAVAVPQNNRRSAALTIFLSGLALDAQAGVRERIEAVEPDGLAALLATAEALGRAVQPAQRLVHVPQVPPLLRREQKLFLAFHRVGALIGHVKGVAREIPVGRLEARVE